MVIEARVTYKNPIFWERMCRVIITLEDGTVVKQENNVLTKEFNGLDVSHLHCIIRFERNLLQSKQYGEITLYNLAPSTEKQILAGASKVVIEAGYNNPDLYGEILTADVVQTQRGKSNPTDYFVKLRFISDNDWLVWGISNFTARKGTNYRELLDVFAKNSTPALEVDESKMPDGWGEDNRLIKGQVFFSTIEETSKAIGRATNSIIRIEEGKVYAVTLEDKDNKSLEAFELNYSTGLVGQPSQTKEGVSFRSLLNPHLLLNSWVHINNALILTEDRNIGENAIGIDLDSDGLYRIISQQFSLDTRGNDWYVDCEAISQAGVIPDMLKDSNSRGI